MIRTLPKKLSELGRIRLGDQVLSASGHSKRPNKLEYFRLTSSNKPLLHFAANCPAIGGEVREWEDAPGDGQQWELYTACNQLAVLIPTFSAISVQYEIWSLSGCQRRCTGETITHCPENDTLEQQDCRCPEDDHERAELAKTGKACARILRLNVILPDLPGIGCWRLETKGYYATAELLGTLEMLQMAGQEHQIIEGVLRLEQRTVKRPGKGEGKGTLHFAVPVLWPTYTPRQLLSKAAENGHLLMAPQRLLDVPSEGDKTLAQHIGDLYGDPAQAEALALQQGTPALHEAERASRALFHEQVEALWQSAGLTAEQIATLWTQHTARFKGELHVQAYPAFLSEQRQWVARRLAEQDRKAEAEAKGEDVSAFDLVGEEQEETLPF